MKLLSIVKSFILLSFLVVAPYAFAIGGAAGTPPVGSQPQTTIAPVDATLNFVNTVPAGQAGSASQNGQMLPSDGCTGTSSGTNLAMATPTSDYIVPTTGHYYATVSVVSLNCNGGSGEWNSINYWIRVWNSTLSSYTNFCGMNLGMWGGGSCGYGGGQTYSSDLQNCSLGLLQAGEHIVVVGQIQSSGTCGPCVEVTAGNLHVVSTN